MSELAVMFPEGKTLSIHDANLTIKPFKFGELSKVIKLTDGIMGDLVGASQSKDITGVLRSVLGDHGEQVAELMAMASKQSVDWVNNLEVDEAIELFAAVIEVNADFFIRKVLPSLTARMQVMAAPQVGSTS